METKSAAGSWGAGEGGQGGDWKADGNARGQGPRRIEAQLAGFVQGALLSHSHLWTRLTRLQDIKFELKLQLLLLNKIQKGS